MSGFNVKRDYLSKRQRLNIQEAEMRTEAVTFETRYRDLSDFILPRRAQFTVTDSNRGERRDLDIIDSTASMASRTLSSGMMTGVTSPARSWFKLKTNKEELNSSAAVKGYFKTVEDLMRSSMLKGNLYNQLPVLYGDLGTFATGALFMEEDLEDVAAFKCFPIGSYMISNDKKGRANAFFREFRLSVRQVVEQFGRLNPIDQTEITWTNISEQVRNYYDNGQMEAKIDVCHFILPNTDFSPNRLEAKFKKYRSFYYEKGISTNSGSVESNSTAYTDMFLKESGYDFFPVMAVRWEVTGEDTYGTNSPGMVAIGDVKALQLGEKRIAQALDHKVKPPMVANTAVRNSSISIIPGDLSYADDKDGKPAVRRLFEMDFDIRELEGKQDQMRQRISKAYYEDLFLMLANSDRRQITATEINERQEEKLLALGPVLERINQDLLDPLIENMYFLMNQQNLLPELPEELLDQDYAVEYISVMAQAQKLAGIGNIERFMGFIGQNAQLDPTIIQQVNMDRMVQEYGDKVGIDPSLIRTQEEMEAIREEQALAAQQEQEMIQNQEAVNTGKTLSETKIDENSALDAVLGGLE